MKKYIGKKVSFEKIPGKISKNFILIIKPKLLLENQENMIYIKKEDVEIIINDIFCQIMDELSSYKLISYESASDLKFLLNDYFENNPDLNNEYVANSATFDFDGFDEDEL